MDDADEESTSDRETDESEPSEPTPTDVSQDLESDGYRRTESECSDEDCDGLIWYHENTIVCAECWKTVDLEEERQSTETADRWETFRADRAQYDNSEKVRLPGGFPQAYDWVTSDDVDGPVRSIRSEEFYL